MTFKKLIDHLKREKVKINQIRLKKAYDYARQAHKGQIRHTGDAYFTHPLQTAKILATWKLPQTVIEAALLHEVMEEAGKTHQELTKLFGLQVVSLINGVSKVGQVKLRHSKDKIFVENLRKMFVGMACDLRVVLIRLADRLHNMQTLHAVPLSKQKRIAEETIEVYAPLAERLGMGKLKGELEDLAFPYLYPTEHAKISTLLKHLLPSASGLTQKMIAQISKAVSKQGMVCDIHGRQKHKYSLFKKLSRPGIDGDIGMIHDLVAIRIITQNKTDCYKALGIVHDLWTPSPHIPISDFIAQPKPNGYQSIHTKVFNRQGQILEVQIRTHQMHHQAEFGAAAHYAYSDAKVEGVKDEQLEQGIAFSVSQKMNWINQLTRWQEAVTAKKQSSADYKLDALAHRIYVFSPKGDVYDLPQASTPLDFAFAVHSQLGFMIQSVRVNQKIASLNSTLNSGDIVEILKSKNKKRPSRDWLYFVKTIKARQIIKQALK